MLRISDLNWPRILYARTAAILLGFAAALTIPALIFFHGKLDPDAYSGLKGGILQVIADLSPLGFISLLVCMAFFWLRCDVSSKSSRTIWFFLLLVGFWYGSQIAYYVLVYLPAVLKQLRNPEVEEAVTLIPQPAELHRRIGPFRRTLVIGWGIVAALMLAILIAPASLTRLSPPIAVAFLLCSVVVAAESVIHWFISIYRSGMARPAEDAEQTARQRKDR